MTNQKYRDELFRKEWNNHPDLAREFGRELLRTKKIGGKRKLYKVIDEKGNVQIKGKLIKVWAKVHKETVKEERVIRPALPQLTDHTDSARSIDDVKKKVSLYTSRYDRKKEVFTDSPLNGEASKEWHAGFYSRMEFIPEKETERGGISQNDENRQILENYFMQVGLFDESD